MISKEKKDRNEGGFVAIMTTMAISALITLAIFPLSHAVYLARSGSLERIFKGESYYSARSCVEAAILLLAEFGVVEGETINTSAVPDCAANIETHDDSWIINVHSASKNHHTSLRATVNRFSKKISFLEERELGN
jgi:hypothetical protein